MYVTVQEFASTATKTPPDYKIPALCSCTILYRISALQKAVSIPTFQPTE